MISLITVPASLLLVPQPISLTSLHSMLELLTTRAPLPLPAKLGGV